MFAMTISFRNVKVKKYSFDSGPEFGWGLFMYRLDFVSRKENE